MRERNSSQEGAKDGKERRKIRGLRPALPACQTAYGVKADRFEPLSRKVIGCALQVHRTLGPGLFESTYEECLSFELKEAGLSFRRQIALPLQYKTASLEAGYRLDIVVENELIVELKSVNELLGLHEAQLITYLKLTRIKVGLLINFNVEVLKDGIRRLVVF